IRFNKDRFKEQVEWWQQRDTATAPVLVGAFKAEKVNLLRPPPAGTSTADQFDYLVRLPTPTRPGFFWVKLLPKAEAIDPTKLEKLGEQLAAQGPDERPMAFNIDNRQEASLQRISEAEFRDQLARSLNLGKAKVAMPEANRYVQEQNWFQVNPLQGEA